MVFSRLPALSGLSLLTVLPVACTGPGSGVDAPRPNVVFIMADDLGYGDIGPYGQSFIRTPHLDRLAAQGLLFTQGYAGCTVSAPSRASLMTGLHTGHTFVRGNKEIKPEGQQPMPEGTFTLARMFREAGYATGAFGKWGLGYPGSTSDPEASGFENFYGYNCQREAHSYYPDHLWENGRRVDFPENVDPGRQTYSHDLIHAKGLDFIRSHADKPFFAYLSYTLPHAEINLPHDSLYHLYCDLIPEADDPAFAGTGSYYASERPMASFAAMVSRLDAYVGEVMDLLDSLGLAENTLLVFTSDNGPHKEGGARPEFFGSSGPLRGIKRDLYEGGIRVPLLMRWPGVVAPATRTDQLFAFWDFLPTFAALSGYAGELQTDGLSFAPLLTGRGKQAEHDYLYWEFHEQGGRQALRQGPWKLIRQQVGKPHNTTLELYNIAADPHEDRDLSAQEPQRVQQLEALMDSARTESELFNFGRPTR